jgi:hypothetical protein
MEAVSIDKIKNLNGSVGLNITKDVIDFNNQSRNYFAAIQPDMKR